HDLHAARQQLRAERRQPAARRIDLARGPLAGRGDRAARQQRPPLRGGPFGIGFAADRAARRGRGQHRQGKTKGGEFGHQGAHQGAMRIDQIAIARERVLIVAG
ncbi:hypothetical protein RZS08_54955, partial [Arthrospira platensis SPKY1]|nr:hypothetical protein [Arthrospira platensis SPKY1]